MHTLYHNVCIFPLVFFCSFRVREVTREHRNILVRQIIGRAAARSAAHLFLRPCYLDKGKNGKESPYSTTESRVPELIPVLASQPAGDVNHKPDGRLPLLSARTAVTLATLKRFATNFAAW